MKVILALLIFLALGLSPVRAENPTQESAAAESLKWDFANAPKPVVAGTGQNEQSADDKTIQDRKADRAFKYDALIALSCTMILLYLVAILTLSLRVEKIEGTSIIHLTSLALIVYGALALALVPTTTEQLTAPIGILGAMAGYLFGHAQGKSSTPEKEGKQ